MADQFAETNNRSGQRRSILLYLSCTVALALIALTATAVYLMNVERLGEFEIRLRLDEAGERGDVTIDMGIRRGMRAEFEQFEVAESRIGAACETGGREGSIRKRSLIDVLMMKPQYVFTSSCTVPIYLEADSLEKIYDVDERHGLYQEGTHDLLRYRDFRGKDMIYRLRLTKSDH